MPYLVDLVLQKSEVLSDTLLVGFAVYNHPQLLQLQLDILQLFLVLVLGIGAVFQKLAQPLLELTLQIEQLPV